MKRKATVPLEEVEKDTVDQNPTKWSPPVVFFACVVARISNKKQVKFPIWEDMPDPRVFEHICMYFGHNNPCQNVAILEGQKFVAGYENVEQYCEENEEIVMFDGRIAQREMACDTSAQALNLEDKGYCRIADLMQTERVLRTFEYDPKTYVFRSEAIFVEGRNYVPGVPQSFFPKIRFELPNKIFVIMIDTEHLLHLITEAVSPWLTIDIGNIVANYARPRYTCTPVQKIICPMCQDETEKVHKEDFFQGTDEFLRSYPMLCTNCLRW